MPPIDEFTEQYIETLLWSSGSDIHFDSLCAHDLAEETLAQVIADCAKFQEDMAPHMIGPGSYAHDFVLTRNGHGAGFWDGDYEEPAATVLTEYCRRAGEFNLYLGDDGKLYATT
jgi:hypothetical protein